MITTKTEQVLKEKYCDVTFDPSTGIMTAKWIGFIKMEEAVKSNKVIVDYQKKYNVTKHFSDQSELKILTKEVQDYLASQMPVVEQNGLRKMAVLMADDIFAQATVANVNMKINVGKLNIQFFNSKNQCINFLN